MSLISTLASLAGLRANQQSLPSTAPVQPHADTAKVRIIGINDFHGQLIDSSSKDGDIEIGGAATLAAYIQRERAGNPNGSIVVSAGDNMGASPPESTLLRHHSTVAVLDAMGLDLSTLGNHEFDNGYAEAMRIIFGDDAYKAALREQKGLPPIDLRKKKRKGANARGDAHAGAKTVAKARGKERWPGTPFPWISSNVVHAKSGKTVLPPYVIKEIDGAKVAFVGATTADLHATTNATGIQNIKSLDIADSVNRYIPEIKAKGVKAIVVVMHEGGSFTKDDPKKVTGPLDDIAKRLDPEVDVIVAGHTRTKMAQLVHGKQVVHTGAYAQGIGVVDLEIDRSTGDVVKSGARLVSNDEKGIVPDARVGALVKRFEKAVAPRTQKIVAKISSPLTRAANSSGETTLGTVIADAQRWKAKTQIAFMNPGGVRKDISTAGPVKWGALFSVQPFANRLVRMSLTGAQVRSVLEEQFPAKGFPAVLQISGLTVHADLTKPAGQRITQVTLPDGSELRSDKTYSVVVNSFLADGGDGFATLKKGRNRKDLGTDLDALVDYLSSGAKIHTSPPGRIVLDAGALASQPE